MNAKTAELGWKILTSAVGALIVPLAGWVWTMNVQVVELENDLDHLQNRVQEIKSKSVEADDNSKSIIGIEKDIEYMKALEAEDDSHKAIAIEKQKLRDIPQTFDLTTENDTVEELKEKWPDGLPKE